MDSLRDGVPHARHRSDDVGARAQVRDLAQEFERVRLRLNRIRIWVLDPANDMDCARLHLEWLSLCRRRHDRAGRFHSASCGETHDLVGVVAKRVGRDDLNGIETGAVGDIYEGNAGLRIAPRPHPALDGDRRVLRRAASENSRATESNHLQPRLKNTLFCNPGAGAITRPSRPTRAPPISTSRIGAARTGRTRRAYRQPDPLPD